MLIEKASVYINNKTKKDWKPFEYISSVKNLYEMRQQLIENRNWNDSRANPLIQINENSQLNIYNETRQLVVNDNSNPTLERLKNRLMSKFEPKDEIED